jgi:nucleoside-diphosphate-sugar epimerase
MDLNSLDIISNKININKLKKNKIKNILITGCSGFIGNYLINTLLNKNIKNNFQIYGIDTIKPKIFKNRKNKNFHFYKKDLFKIKTFNLNKKIDLIVHLAGIPSPSFYKLKPLETFYLNSELCKIFLDYAKRKKSKFVYFSSSEIYGNPDSKNIPTKENYEGRVSSIGDRSCYDESKRAGETYTFIYKSIYKINCNIIRPFNFYGNGMKQNDKRVIPQFFNTALSKKIILPFSNGKQTRSYCHIIDAIPQIINICFYGKKFVYNIGNSSQEIKASELAKKIKKIINNKSIVIKNIPYPNSYPSSEPLRRCPDTSNLKSEFNYRPTVNIDLGLRLFCEYAKKNFLKKKI